MTRHTNAAKDLAALLADASPDVAQGNAAVLLALRAEIAADAAYLQPVRTAEYTALLNAGSLGGAVPDEHDEQAALFRWAEAMEAQHPELALLVAFPNGGYRPIATAAKLKMEGVKAGLPDMALFCRRGKYGALFIELKRADGGRVSAEQKAWIERLRNYGYSAVICRGAEEAKQCIMAYLMQGEDGAA